MLTQRAIANMRYNFQGNTVDESGGSWYVIDESDERVAGPFASASYAQTVRERMDWRTDLDVEYDI